MIASDLKYIDNLLTHRNKMGQVYSKKFLQDRIDTLSMIKKSYQFSNFKNDEIIEKFNEKLLQNGLSNFRSSKSAKFKTELFLEKEQEITKGEHHTNKGHLNCFIYSIFYFKEENEHYIMNS